MTYVVTKCERGDALRVFASVDGVSGDVRDQLVFDIPSRGALSCDVGHTISLDVALSDAPADSVPAAASAPHDHIVFNGHLVSFTDRGAIISNGGLLMQIPTADMPPGTARGQRVTTRLIITTRSTAKRGRGKGATR